MARSCGRTPLGVEFDERPAVPAGPFSVLQLVRGVRSLCICSCFGDAAVHGQTV